MKSYNVNLLRSYNVSQQRKFSEPWQTKKPDNPTIASVFNEASKQLTEQRGEPDFFYVNEARKLLIIVENKDSITQHEGEMIDKNIPLYAVNGLLHYLSFVSDVAKMTSPVQAYLQGWCIVGIALSGDITSEYNHKISTFMVKEGTVRRLEIKEILHESDYIELFNSYDLEAITE